MQVEVIVPEVGEVGSEVTFVAWLVEDGAQVEVGDPLFEVDTAKAVLIVEAYAAGRLTRIDVVPGEVVEPHQVMGTLDDGLVDDMLESDTPASEGPPHVSPRARHLAQRLGVPLGNIRGSGPGGRIQESDVQAMANSGQTPDVAPPSAGEARRSITVRTTADVEAIDITDDIAAVLRVTDGLVWLSTPHTTSAIIICEGDPEMLADVVTLARGLLAPLEPFRHRRHDNPNGRAHLMSSVMGTQLILGCADGAPMLGTWQRILFLELDGPKDRTVRVERLAAAERGATG